MACVIHYIVNREQKTDNNNETIEPNRYVWFEFCAIKDAYIVLDSENEVKNTLWYKLDDFKHNEELELKYFGLLNVSYPTNPWNFPDRIYEYSIGRKQSRSGD